MRLFREIAKAIIEDLPPETEAERKKRREETRGGFILAARRVVSDTRRIIRQFRKLAVNVKRYALPVYFFHDPGFNCEERRAEDARILGLQLEEWAAQEEGSHEQQTSFHPAAGADFDLHL